MHRLLLVFLLCLKQKSAEMPDIPHQVVDPFLLRILGTKGSIM